jgi:hypothetical protein
LLFSCSCCARRNRSSRPIAVHPSILPFPCLLLNPVPTGMLFFPVFATLQPGPPPARRCGQAELSRFFLSPIPAIQPLCFQTLTDSSAQWAPATPYLSIACGLFPSPWGCIPPYFYSPLSLAVHERRNCAAGMARMELGMCKRTGTRAADTKSRNRGYNSGHGNRP